jgi:hypothetical protein
MKFIKNISNLVFRNSGQPPQKISLAPIGEVLQAPHSQKKNILNNIYGIKLGP